jgi:hypothetical protein
MTTGFDTIEVDSLIMMTGDGSLDTISTTGFTWGVGVLLEMRIEDASSSAMTLTAAGLLGTLAWAGASVMIEVSRVFSILIGFIQVASGSYPPPLHCPWALDPVELSPVDPPVIPPTGALGAGFLRISSKSHIWVKLGIHE